MADDVGLTILLNCLAPRPEPTEWRRSACKANAVAKASYFEAKRQRSWSEAFEELCRC
jgi:hypothetical protein